MYLLSCGVYKLSLEAVPLIFHKGLTHSADVRGRRHLVVSGSSTLHVEIWASPFFFLLDLQDPQTSYTNLGT